MGEELVKFKMTNYGDDHLDMGLRLTATWNILPNPQSWQCEHP
jgi:hypothetical protein